MVDGQVQTFLYSRKTSRIITFTYKYRPVPDTTENFDDGPIIISLPLILTVNGSTVSLRKKLKKLADGDLNNLRIMPLC